jgi:hypothetical protein
MWRGLERVVRRVKILERRWAWVGFFGPALRDKAEAMEDWETNESERRKVVESI